MKRMILLSIFFVMLFLPIAHAVSLTVSSFKCNDAVSLSIESGANMNCVARVQNNDGSSSATVNTVKLSISGNWAEQTPYTKSASTTIAAGGSTDISFEGIKSITTGNNLKFSSIDIDGTQHAEEVSSAAINSMAIKTLSVSSSSTSVGTGSEFSVTPSVSVGGSFNSMSFAISLSGCSLKSGESSTKTKQESMSDNTVWSPSPWTLVQGSGASCSITVAATGTTDTVTLAKSKSLAVSNPSYVAPDNGGSNAPSAGGAGGGASDNKKNVIHKPLSPGLSNNTKLQAAIEKVFAKGKLNQNAVDNLVALSNAIAGETTITRAINSGSSKSNVTTKIKYLGAKVAKNFVVYEKVPKTFANSSDLITITATGAKVEVVEKDPEYAIMFDTVNPNQELEIIYSVNKAVSTSTVDSFASEVYAESLVETQTTQTMCAQVITSAKNPATGECKEFPTPCDVPVGWTKVDSCKTAGASINGTTANNVKSQDAFGSNTITTIAIVLITILIIVVGYIYFKKKRESF